MDVNITNLTVRTQEILNSNGTVYTVKEDRINAYLELIQDNTQILSLAPARVKEAVGPRVPKDLSDLVRNAPGYADLKKNWDWPRGVLATLVALRETEDTREYSNARG